MPTPGPTASIWTLTTAGVAMAVSRHLGAQSTRLSLRAQRPWSERPALRRLTLPQCTGSPLHGGGALTAEWRRSFYFSPSDSWMSLWGSITHNENWILPQNTKIMKI